MKNNADKSKTQSRFNEWAPQLRREPHNQQLAMLVTGGSAVTFGLAQRGWLRALGVLGGGYLLYRAADGGSLAETSFTVSQTIGRSPQEVAAFLREFEHWPRFGSNAGSLDRFSLFGSAKKNNRLSRQSDKKEWEQLDMVEGLPENQLAWRYCDSDNAYEAAVELNPAPGNRGTEVQLKVTSLSPASPVKEALKLSVGLSMEQRAREQLRACKQLMEAGEIPTTDGQPVGKRGLKGKGLRVLLRERPVERKRPVSPTPSQPQYAAS